MISTVNFYSAANGRAGVPPAGRVGAVVVGGDYQGLGIVRSLGRQNVPICIIDDEFSISRVSRYATHSVRVPNLLDERQAVDNLLATGRRLGLKGWVLYPTRDETVAAIARNRDQMSELFRVPTPAWDTIQWVWDKRNTYRLASELQIPTPQTWYPRNLADLEQISGTPPFAVKPAIKEHFFYATKAKAWRADNAAELRERFQMAEAQVEDGEVMIQQLIPGGGDQQFAYCAFFKEGRAIASMVVNRARQHPPEFGRASTYVQTVNLPILEELSERFLRAINYYGLVEMEYKLDRRDNQYRLLDVNGRTWGYHSLGAAAGVDFSLMLFEDQLGHEVRPVRARPGVNWIRLTTDLPVGIPAVLRGQARLSSYLKSVCCADSESVFSLRDPLPGLLEIALIPYLIYKRGF
jgi:D-aspartate ligase